MLVLMSRVLPIALSLLLALWAKRRLGARVLEPVPLLSLIATALGLRLAFEQNLFGYYFMALAVSLVVLDIVGGRIRGELVAWIALVTLAFSPVPWGFMSNSVAWGLQEREFLPFIMIGIGLAIVVWDARRGRARRYLVAWLTVVVLAFGRLPWSMHPFRHNLPTWCWQSVLVTTGLTLALRPLLSYRRSEPASNLTRMAELSYAE